MCSERQSAIIHAAWRACLVFLVLIITFSLVYVERVREFSASITVHVHCERHVHVRIYCRLSSHIHESTNVPMNALEQKEIGSHVYETPSPNLTVLLYCRVCFCLSAPPTFFTVCIVCVSVFLVLLSPTQPYTVCVSGVTVYVCEPCTLECNSVLCETCTVW